VPKAPYHRRPAGVCCYHRDDGSRLALHWAAELGMVEVTQLLLQETVAAAQHLRQQMEAAGDTADSYAPMNVVQIQVRSQPPCRALHALESGMQGLACIRELSTAAKSAGCQQGVACACALLVA
jgi:enamine deaminase RidA (YjgF/YER057c/UK114 family)